MHSRIPKAGVAVGVTAGIIASSLAMMPASFAAEEETAGNNLAVPVIWSEDGYEIELRGVEGAPVVTGAKDDCDSTVGGPVGLAALQQDPINTWRAQTKSDPGNLVDELDWGDNLGQDWRVGQKVRVEAALYKDVTDAPMDGYVMCYIEGSGQTEMWGAVLDAGGGGTEAPEGDNSSAPEGDDSSAPEGDDSSAPEGDDSSAPEGDNSSAPEGDDSSAPEGDDSSAPEGDDSSAPEGDDSSAPEDVNGGGGQSLTAKSMTEAMIYTAGARLTIQRIDAGATPTWDATQRRWVGSGVAEPVYTGAIHEGGEGGPGNFGSEVNVAGKLIYGFLWETDGLFQGEYRITFSLDAAIPGVFPGSGTSLESAQLRESEEESSSDSITAFAMGMGPGGGSGTGGHQGGGSGTGGHQGGGSGTGGHEGGDSGGESDPNTAVMLGEQNLSYIDVGLTDGEDPPVVPNPNPTNPPAPPSTDGGASIPSGSTGGSTADSGASDAGNPGAGVPVEVASPVQAQQRIRQRALIKAPKSSKQLVRTRLMLTEGPVFTDQGVTVRWRVTKRSQDNCTIRKRDGEVTVKFTKRGRCTVVAWAPSPNPLVYAPFNEKRIYKVRNTL